MQRIVKPRNNDEDLFSFNVTNVAFEQLDQISNFDMLNGHLIRVHLLKQENNDKSFVQKGDFVIFNFHLSVFDAPSLSIFCRDLSMAYECETTLSYSDTELSYIDCKLNNHFFFYLCITFCLIRCYC